MITVGVGWWKFVRGRKAAQAPAGGAVLAGEAEARLAAVEAKLDALGRALRE